MNFIRGHALTVTGFFIFLAACSASKTEILDANACAEAKRVTNQCTSSGSGIKVDFDQSKCETGGDQAKKAADCIVANKDRCECAVSCALVGTCAGVSTPKFDPGDGSIPFDSGLANLKDSAATDKDATAIADSSVDSPVVDGNHPSDSSQTCAPGSIAGFAPAWHPPRPKQSVCSNTQISDFYSNCMGPTATTTTCQQFMQNTANASCSQCLTFSSPTDATYGPVITSAGIDHLNVPGCAFIAKSEPNASGCGGALQATSQCEDRACASNCPVTDEVSFSSYVACEDQAANGVCTSYATSADAACAGLTECSGGTFAAAFGAVARVMCGL